MQISEQLGGGAEQDGVAGQYGGMADVLGDHGYSFGQPHSSRLISTVLK